MTTAAEIATAPSKTDLLMHLDTVRLVNLIEAGLEKYVEGVSLADRVVAWNGILTALLHVEVLKKRLKVRVGLEE